MDSKLFSFIAASFTSLWWTNLPSIVITLLLFMCACLTIRKNQHLGYFLLGIIWMASVGHWQYSLQLSSEQTSQPVQIIGEVNSLVITEKNIRFNIKVTHIADQHLLFTKIFHLSWREPAWQVQQGQRVKLWVKVKPPHGLANEAGFNYQQWLFSEGINATGYVKSDDDNTLLANVNSIRQTLLNRMLGFDLPQRSWLAAVTFGYRGLLQQEDWHLVQKTGVAHLIAISGLHLALVASVSYVLIAWAGGGLISRFYSLHHINLHNVAMLLTLFTTLAYSALAGFGLPTLRAWLMLFLFSVLFLWNKHLGARRLILLGLTGFVFLFPLSIFGLSFWLSFSAVTIICFIFWRWPVKQANFSLTAIFSGMVKVQLCLTVLMLPLVAWQFSYVSTVSPLVNLIAVPVVTMVLVPICLVAVICLAFSPDWAFELFSYADLILSYGLTFLNFALKIKASFFNIPTFPAAVWFFVFLFVLGCCLPSFWLNKKYLFLLLVPLASHLLSPKINTWQLDVLDVGHGLAVLISKNNHAIIYDVGASYPSGFNMADSVLLPILQARGFSKVDVVFISHKDNDHAGSLPQLLKGIEVSQVITNQDKCQQDFAISWQGLSIEALWPDNALKHNDNNGSCVIKVSDQYHSILLPGDINKSIEKQLVGLYPKQLKSDILVAAHHGSNTSSSAEFIQTVGAKYVIFSQGFMNRWRFPRQEVVDRYQTYNPILFSTSHSGQVSFQIEYNSTTPVILKTFRQDIYPYWYANSTHH
ncbi:DNA internalization-related competence protein ComEC/Rec2 [Paraglaciecola psychrophila]|nr:DNA internalization-related competence protein ComEC/Rec2 [Paraglaciecola psychrophila]